jgi:hypothetical protein
MAMSQKFGFGPPGMGMGSGMGSGMSGMMATSATGGRPQQSLLGGESRLGRRDRPESATASKGHAAGTPAPGANLSGEPDANASGITAASRAAVSAIGDAAAEEYRDLVDAYFKKLTVPAP